MWWTFRKDLWKKCFETSLFGFFRYTTRLPRSFYFFRATLMFSVLKRKADSLHSSLPYSFWNKQHIRCLRSWAAFWLGCFARKGAGHGPSLAMVPAWTLPAQRAAAGLFWALLGSVPTCACDLGHKHRVHLPGSGALMFCMACAALPFPNPAPGLEKPLNESPYDLLAGQTITMPSRAPGQEGFCWSHKYSLACFSQR